MSEKVLKSARNPYFDFLRGLAILLVVAIHCYPHGHTLSGSVSECVQLVVINICNCAVPLFLAISGYFIGRKKLDSLSDCRRFWAKQIPMVYIPCLVFSFPSLLIDLQCVLPPCAAGGLHDVMIAVAKYFLCGYSIYYFIALIVQCYLLAPVLVKHNNVRTLVAVCAVSLVATAGVEYVRFVEGRELPLLAIGNALTWLLFFFIGIYLSKHGRGYRLGVPVAMIVAGLLLGMVQMQYIRNVSEFGGEGQKLGLYIFDVGVILLCMSNRCERLYAHNAITRSVLFVGEISFGIYFTHIYLIGPLKRIFPMLGGDSWLMLWGATTLLTIGIIVAVKKVAPEYSRKYLGYR